VRWLRRHQTAIGLIAVVVFAWASIWVVYDHRSPVSQFLRGIGTTRVDGWSLDDLDAVCLRLEPAAAPPTTTAVAAIGVATNTYVGGYIREVALVSMHDTCSGAAARLAWAVSMSWEGLPGVPATNGPGPRAIVMVDAISGKLITSHALG
jgi:hypothetical protein